MVPWVRVQNLLSTTLSLALRRLPHDWQAGYQVGPLLVETLVNPARYSAAVTGLPVGSPSSRRGRDDRAHQRRGLQLTLPMLLDFIHVAALGQLSRSAARMDEAIPTLERAVRLYSEGDEQPSLELAGALTKLANARLLCRRAGRVRAFAPEGARHESRAAG